MATDAGTAYIDVEERLDKLGHKLDRDGPSLFSGLGAKMAKGFAVAFTAGIAGGAVIFQGLVSAGSDLQETLSKSREIFGENAAAMEKWASTAATSFGQSKREALDAAATFGNLFLQLDIGGEQATSMSRGLTELASDFASFHNAAPTDVIEAMTAAFRGEYDAVQRFVPTINAANVETKALEMGLAGSTKELTSQHKALATEALLMEGAGKAMGDFDRTAGGLANQMRIAKARFEDFKAGLGTALIPVALAAMQILGRLGEVVKTFFDALRTGFTKDEGTPIEMFALKVRALGLALVPVIEFVRDNVIPILAAIGTVLVAAVIPSITAAAAAVAGFFSPVVLIVAGIAALVAALVYAYTHFEGFRNVVNAVVAVVVGAFASLVGWVREHWAQISEAIGHVVAVISALIEGWVLTVTTLWRIFGDEILGVANAVWGQIQNVIETVVAIIGGIIEFGLAVINGEWAAAGEALGGIVSAAFNFLVETIRNAVGVGMEIIKAIPGEILGALGDLGGILYDAGWSIISGLWNGMVDRAEGMLRWVGGLAGKIISLKGPLDYDKRLLTPAGEAIIAGLIVGMQNEESRLVSHLARVTSMVGTMPTVDAGRMTSAVSSLGAAPTTTGAASITQHNTFMERQDPLHLARELAWVL